MWKDFFYFTKAQQGGVVALAVLIVLVFVANMAIPWFMPDAGCVDTEIYAEELQEFKATLLSKDSLKAVEQGRKEEERKARYRQALKEPQEAYVLSPFDPNEADSLAFIRLGLSSKITSNIMKYRLKGGRFKEPDDFRKIYGLSESKFLELKPYILMPPSVVAEKTFAGNHSAVDTMALLEEVPEDFPVVDLNVADTSELMKVKGIGPYYAREIVRFRNMSGGFVSVEQLLELKHMRPENYERIKSCCVVDTAKVKRIQVNRASVDYLKRHPYINFYQAKVIYELRRTKGRLKSMDELRRFDEFSDEDIRRLTPYLSFE